MARGGYGQGPGVPLRDRVRGHQHFSTEAGRERLACPARHCWVLAPADGVQPRPCLLVEWRRSESPDGWVGRVFYVAELRAGHWSVVEEWIPAGLLKKPQPTGDAV